MVPTGTMLCRQYWRVARMLVQNIFTDNSSRRPNVHGVLSSQRPF